MPTDTKPSTTERKRRYFAGGRHVYQQGFCDPLCTVTLDATIPEVRAAKIAAALNAAEGNRDRPWVGDGPTPEEAGGQRILIRVGEDLVRASWCVPSDDGFFLEGWYDDLGCRLPGEHPPTGWRPMLKVNP